MMKHITEEYGAASNLLQMKSEDFYILRDFLQAEGVQIRMISEYDGTCLIQLRNCYKNVADKATKEKAEWFLQQPW